MPGPGAIVAVALLLLFFLLQSALYAWLGRGLLRSFTAIDPWAARVPEFAFLIGCSAAALLGYAVLAITASAVPVIPACVAVAAGLHFAARRRPEATILPALLESYAAFRSTRAGRLCCAVALLFVFFLSLHRAWWLVEWTADGSVTLGTSVWDDLRTIGFPLTLAAHGYPMRSPQALDTLLAYPLGAFVVSAGMVALFPQQTLPVILADVACGGVFYALVVLFTVAALLQSGAIRMLAALSGFIGVSFNLWPLPIDRTSSWFITLFGYYRRNGFQTTIAWTPFYGNVWNQNHGIGFAAALLAVLLFRDARFPRWLVYLPALHVACSSMDMAAMSLGAVGLWAVLYRDRPLIRQVAPIAIAAFLLLAIVNTPTLLRRTDYPDVSAFYLSSMPMYDLGVFACTLGAYVLLLLLAGAAGAWPVRIWMVPVLALLLFSAVFGYYSIWYWRASIALHLLFAILCGQSGQRLRPALQRVFLLVWAMALTIGAVQVATEISIGYRYRDRRPAAQRDVYAWVQRNTRLSDRVAAFLDPSGVLAPDVDFLRTGNRAGNSTYDRDHPLVGYRRYRQRMAHISEGITAADYIVYWRDNTAFAGLLEACGAKPAFQNAAGVVYAIPDVCRDRIWSGVLTPQLADYRQDWLRRHDPLDELSLRRKVEELWARKAFTEAERTLRPVVTKYPRSGEAMYELAVTLQYLNRCPEAIGLHEKALANGYAEFWVRLNRGTCLVLMNQRDAARQELQRARELRGDHEGLNQMLRQIK